MQVGDVCQWITVHDNQVRDTAGRQSAKLQSQTEGGCRVQLQMTDADPKEVKLDLPVEFAFRKIHEAGGTPNYFWKCTPVR